MHACKLRTYVTTYHLPSTPGSIAFGSNDWPPWTQQYSPHSISASHPNACLGAFLQLLQSTVSFPKAAQSWLVRRHAVLTQVLEIIKCFSNRKDDAVRDSCNWLTLCRVICYCMQKYKDFMSWPTTTRF